MKLKSSSTRLKTSITMSRGVKHRIREGRTGQDRSKEDRSRQGRAGEGRIG